LLFMADVPYIIQVSTVFLLQPYN